MTPAIAALRGRIRLLERPAARPGGILPFGVSALDAHLPEAGLQLGALHEVAGGGADEIQGACAALFVAPERVLHVAAPHERDVLAVMEEALRHTGLAAVVGELARLPMVASRRLVLAAEKSGIMALALRRRREGMAAETGFTAAATRWCVTPLASTPLPYPGIGRARWQVALTRCRGGQTGDWIMEACDAQGCLALPAELAHRPLAADARRGAYA